MTFGLALAANFDGVLGAWRDWHANATRPAALAETLARERNKALLFRTLATLRSDLPLFKKVEELRWKGHTSAFPELAARLDRAGTS